MFRMFRMHARTTRRSRLPATDKHGSKPATDNHDNDLMRLTSFLRVR